MTNRFTKGLAYLRAVLNTLLGRGRRNGSGSVTRRSPEGAELALFHVQTLEEFRAHAGAMAEEYRRRRTLERSVIVGESFLVPGTCHVCARQTAFYCDFLFALRDETGQGWPNYRERLVCPLCRLNNRMRAAIHLFERLCRPAHDAAIYVTEQTTPLFAAVRERYPQTVGSEYLGEGLPFGTCDARGIRNESLTCLSFPDAHFDFILSFDVFEHIPDYQRALAECLRCLKPGGRLFFTVPFALDADEHIVRARLGADGAVEYILPPEYHGDPLSSAGCLCFYHFGWRLLREMRQSGYDSAEACLYWSEDYGYLGGEQLLFVAAKGAG